MESHNRYVQRIAEYEAATLDDLFSMFETVEEMMKQASGTFEVTMIPHTQPGYIMEKPAADSL